MPEAEINKWKAIAVEERAKVNYYEQAGKIFSGIPILIQPGSEWKNVKNQEDYRQQARVFFEGEKDDR